MLRYYVYVYCYKYRLLHPVLRSMPLFITRFWKKTQFIHFRTTNALIFHIQIGYQNKLISNTLHSKFIGLTTKNILLWNTHVNQLITKLSRACYMIRTIKTFMLTDVLITVYHTCFYSLMSYGLIFWGNPSYGIKISWLWKKVTGIITGIRNKEIHAEIISKH